MNHPFYPQQSETVQEISIIAQFIHDNPVMSMFIIVLLFILAVMILSSIGAPVIKKFAKRWLGDYGTDDSGNEIRHEDIQLKQLEYERKNHTLLLALCDKAKIKVVDKDAVLI